MEGLKRITPEEAKDYVRLDIYNPNVCKLATAFTLTPSMEYNPAATQDTPSTTEDVTYYTTQSELDRHPLEILLEEWSDSRQREIGENNALK